MVLAPALPDVEVAVAGALDGEALAAAEAAGHADGLAHEADAVAGAGLGGDAEHALDGRGQAQTKAGEEGGEGAAGDEGHDDEHEDLEGVALGVVDEVAQEALELLERALHERGPRLAAVVRVGAAWSGRSGTHIVSVFFFL